MINTADWQETVDILSKIVDMPAALIMRCTSLDIEVFVSSQGEGNPYQVGGNEKLMGSG